MKMPITVAHMVRLRYRPVIGDLYTQAALTFLSSLENDLKYMTMRDS